MYICNTLLYVNESLAKIDFHKDFRNSIKMDFAKNIIALSQIVIVLHVLTSFENPAAGYLLRSNILCRIHANPLRFH